eukprot:SAG11_NODE_29414_length_311_cov_0.683962_1_plen_31_part_10
MISHAYVCVAKLADPEGIFDEWSGKLRNTGI